MGGNNKGFFPLRGVELCNSRLVVERRVSLTRIPRGLAMPEARSDPPLCVNLTGQVPEPARSSSLLRPPPWSRDQLTPRSVSLKINEWLSQFRSSSGRSAGAASSPTTARSASTAAGLGEAECGGAGDQGGSQCSVSRHFEPIAILSAAHDQASCLRTPHALKSRNITAKRNEGSYCHGAAVPAFTFRSGSEPAGINPQDLAFVQQATASGLAEVTEGQIAIAKSLTLPSGISVSRW
jgi:hypothetical protein